MKRLRVLIGCEHSGIVRDAFAKLGHDAWSCDLLPCESGGQHILGDVGAVLADGWDLGIFHPPCTFVSVSGMHWTVRGLRDPKLTTEAIHFAEMLWDALIPRVCIENPVGVLSTRSRLGKSSQTIQPFEFGDDASKKTCLWLRGLPPLVKDPANRVAGRKVEWPKGSGKIVERWANQTDSGQNRIGPSDDRWAKRSKTYAGIALAMAQQFREAA